MKKLLLIFGLLTFGLFSHAQTTVVLNPAKDNTLFESASGSLSNGAGIHLFSGSTNGGSIRRAILQFDLSSIPSNAIISSASLSLEENKGSNGTQNFTLHRMTADWGEGTSDAGSPGGGGTAATTGDATWIHRLFSTSNWTTAGGDFMLIASAAGTCPSGTGPLTMTGGVLASDIQNIINGTNPNFGWLLKGNEGSTRTAKRFHSKETPITQLLPKLFITYTLSIGMDELELQESVSVFPSPAEDFLQLDGDLSNFIGKVSIYDMSGRQVSSLELSNKIDISKLTGGVYFLELKGRNGQQIIKRMIKR